jgi:arylamine N-acetyltransferase
LATAGTISRIIFRAQRVILLSTGKSSVQGGRGGSCTLNNGFFGTVMRSLSYDTMSAGTRVAHAVNGGPKYVFGGWDRMTNIVTIAGKKYLVDVGFGGNGRLSLYRLKIEMRWGMTYDKM